MSLPGLQRDNSGRSTSPEEESWTSPAKLDAE